MSRELRAREYTAASLPGGSVGRVVRARYGKGDVWADVTELVSRHVSGAGGLPHLNVDNATMGGDPVHGTVKELVVTYAPPAPRRVAGDVALKVQIRRGERVKQYRRVCLARPSFAALQSVMRWWVSGDYKIQYVDPDGDDVTVCSQVEWEECLRLWEVATAAAPAPLRLVCQLPKPAPPPDAPERARVRGCASAGCPHAAHPDAAPWNGGGEFCCRACMRWGGLRHGGRCQRLPRPGAAPFTVQACLRRDDGGAAAEGDEQLHCGCGHALRRMQIGEGAGQTGYRTHSCSRCGNEVAGEVARCAACDYDVCPSCAGQHSIDERAAVQRDVVSAVLDRQHGAHALQRLSAGGIDGEAAAAAAGGWLKVYPVRGGCDLDVDVAALAEQLHRSGMAALDGGAGDDAAMWFALQSRLCPGDAAAAYNLACAAALLGDADRAFDALRDALARGYDNAAHMLWDPDLASLRGDARWQAAVGAISVAADTTAPEACVEKQQQYMYTQQLKELKKQEKKAMNEDIKQEKKAKKEEKKLEKEAKKGEKKLQKEAKKEEKEAGEEDRKQGKVAEKELKNAGSDSGSESESAADTAPPATEVEGVVVAAEPPAAAHPRFAAQLRVLHAMGLCDDGLNVAALERAGGDVQRAVPTLLD